MLPKREQRENDLGTYMEIKPIKTEADYEATLKELEPYIGSRARVSEILNRKRPLTLAMIQRLNQLGIPAASQLWRS
jgi:antitoxin component HigA of HigAB toxin-antitoxin module